jgi:ribosomal protein S18 acetylase RimI-like enzyme
MTSPHHNPPAQGGYSSARVRPMRAADGRDLLALLEWMDAKPEREVLAPHARSLEDLHWECQGRTALVELNRFEEVVAYAGLAPHHHGWVLEGPLATGSHHQAVLAEALHQAKQLGLEQFEAFAEAHNTPVRQAFEAVGLTAFRQTDFFMAARQRLLAKGAKNSPAVAIPEPYVLLPQGEVAFAAYRSLYHDASDGWLQRLKWSERDFEQHMHDPDVALLVLARPDRAGVPQAVGYCELEWCEDSAEISYLGVHPSARGRGLGTALLRLAIHTALGRPEVLRLVGRAHDHEAAAARLFTSHGFRVEKSIVAYVWQA